MATRTFCTRPSLRSFDDETCHTMYQVLVLYLRTSDSYALCILYAVSDGILERTMACTGTLCSTCSYPYTRMNRAEVQVQYLVPGTRNYHLTSRDVIRVPVLAHTSTFNINNTESQQAVFNLHRCESMNRADIPIPSKFRRRPPVDQISAWTNTCNYS